MHESTTQVRVRYAETDQMKIVYYGNYAQYFEVGRVEAIRQLGFSYKALEEAGVILPVVEMDIRFLRSAVYDDLLTVKSIIKTLPFDHRIEFFQEIYNEQGKLLTTGRILLYAIDIVTQKRTKIPGMLHEKFVPYFNG